MPSRVTGGPAAAMKDAATPQAFSTGSEVAEMNSPQTLRRGNSAFSTSATPQPACARRRAAAAPPGPAPMTRTSCSMARRQEMGERKDAALVQRPAAAPGPKGRQVPPMKSRAHAGQGVVAGDVIGAQRKHQPRAQNREARTARLAG